MEAQQTISPYEMYCFSCGSIIKKEAEICPKCGVRQNTVRNPEGSPEVFCKSCGEKIKREAEICPKCGVRQFSVNEQRNNAMNVVQNKELSMVAYVLLGLFFAAHRLYAGQKHGVLYLVLDIIAWLTWWFLVGFIIGLVMLIFVLIDISRVARDHQLIDAAGNVKTI